MNKRLSYGLYYPPEGRHRPLAFAAIILSLLLHLLLYLTVGTRPMALFDLSGRRADEAGRKSRQSATRVEMVEMLQPHLADPLRIDAAWQDVQPGTALAAERLAHYSAATIFEPPAAALDHAPLQQELATQFTPAAPQDLPVPFARQEILSMIDAAARDHRAPIPRREIPLIERQPLAPDITTTYDLLEGLPQVAASLPMPSIQSGGAALQLPPELASGGDSELHLPEIGPEDEGSTSTELVAEVPAAVAPAYPLEDRLRIETTVFSDSHENGYHYFMIDVLPRDAAALPVLPCDIVFVQDTSASMAELFLRPSRQALLEGLELLQPGDRFNIVEFSHEVRSCFPQWMAPDAAAIETARDFVTNLKPAGNTDIFASMSAVLQMPRSADRPVIALLVTDGIVTAGEIPRDSQIIGTFSRFNAGAVSVFTVGTHRRANAFLLDMLSYANRGAMTAVAPDRFTVKQTIVDAIRTVRRPILTDVRFNFDVVSGSEVFPVLTTNLYENRPLRLFGRVVKTRPDVAFQARGKAAGESYDMLFEVDLAGREMRQGEAALAQAWATQKMYDLVLQYARTDDHSLVAQMAQLGASYGIPVPYSGRIMPNGQ